MSDSDIEMDNIELMNSMLTTDLDNIEDLPDFVIFPVGQYQFSCDMMEVDVDQQAGKANIKARFAMKAPIELAKDDEVAPEEGSLLGAIYGKEFGIKKFKKTFLPVMEELGCQNLQEFIEQAKDLDFALHVGKRLGKEDDLDDNGNRKVYNDIKFAQLA